MVNIYFMRLSGNRRKHVLRTCTVVDVVRSFNFTESWQLLGWDELLIDSRPMKRVSDCFDEIKYCRNMCFFSL